MVSIAKAPLEQLVNGYLGSLHLDDEETTKAAESILAGRTKSLPDVLVDRLDTDTRVCLHAARSMEARIEGMESSFSECKLLLNAIGDTRSASATSIGTLELCGGALLCDHQIVSSETCIWCNRLGSEEFRRNLAQRISQTTYTNTVGSSDGSVDSSIDIAGHVEEIAMQIVANTASQQQQQQQQQQQLHSASTSAAAAAGTSPARPIYSDTITGAHSVLDLLHRETPSSLSS